MRKRIGAVVDVVVIGAVAFFLLSPNGPIGSWFTQWRTERLRTRAIEENWKDIISEGGRMGSAEANRVLVEFVDYQCPFCRQMHPLLERLLERHPDLTIVHRHLPLTSIHPSAAAAAKASICAEQFSVFPQAHDALLTSDHWQEDVDWGHWAARFGVDERAFEDCYLSDETGERLQRDIELAAALQFQTTPTFVTEAGVKFGALTLSELEALLDL